MSETTALRSDLSRIRNNILAAIKQGSDSGVTDGLRIYRELIHEFVVRLQQYNAKYDRAAASRELNQVFGFRWPEIDWIKSDFVDVLKESFLYPRQDILGEVLYFPVAVGADALRVGDYLSFHTFASDTYVHAYHLLRRVSDEDIREFVVDRLWRHLREFADYHVRFHAARVSEPAGLDRLRDFAVGILLIFEKLLKAAFDARKLSEFKEFCSRLNGLFTGFHGFVENADWVRRHHKFIGESDPVALRLADVQDEVDDIRDQVRFGISGWIAKARQNGGLTLDQFDGWHQSCRLNTSTSRLTQVYLQARSHTVADLHAWDWWATEGQSEGQAMSIDTTSFLDLNYVLHGMLTGSGASDTIQPCRELLYIADGPTSPLSTTATTVLQNAEYWGVGADAAGRWETVAALLREAIQDYKRIEANQLVEATLRDDRVLQFSNDILSGYGRNQQLRQLIAKYRSEERQPTPHPGRGWGRNTTLPKDIFTSDNVHIDGFGESFGNEVARALDENAVKSIANALNPDGEALNDLDEFLRDGIAALKKEGFDPIIVAIRAYNFDRFLKKRSDFKRDYSDRSHQLMGTFQDTPVFLFNGGDRAALIIADFAQLGRWVQYTAVETDFEKPLGTELLIALRPVTEEMARNWVAADEQFLMNEGVKETPDVAIHRLRQRVHFKLVGNAAYEIVKESAGRFTWIGGEETDNGEDVVY